MTFPADRRVSTRFSLVDVELEHHQGGVYARLARPQHCPRLRAVRGAIGGDEVEACERLQSAIERFGADEPTPSRRRMREN